MVEDPHINECERINQPAGDGAVSVGGRTDAGRVVVRQDAGGGVVSKSGLDDFARVDAAAVDRAAKEFVVLYEAVAVV